MGIYIDPELYKPILCSHCGSHKIANMLNEGVIRCLGCGREKPDSNSPKEMLRREMGDTEGNNTYTPPQNPKPYRLF
jgi:hypothetical protein